MDVKYKENEWNKSKDALKGLINSGWFSGKGVTDYLKDINRNFEDAQNDIRKDDPDGAISFSFTDKESSYQKMFEKMETLQDYAGEAGRLVERVIDEPFYKDIDKFVEKMEALSIEDYETKNTIGATTTITTNYGYGYGGAPQTTTVPKDKINLSDIMAGDNFFADNLKAQFAEYSKQNPDQEFTYEQYQSAVSSSRAFEYESIRDGQQNIEFWRDIGIAVVIIATSIVCPPAGLALGIAYGTLELSSAATGKDWLTGREMDAGERATRGAFALLDIIPGVKGLHAFSTATKAGGVALDAVQAGSKLTLKQTAKQGLSNLDAMGKQALRESAERIRNVPKVLKDTANTVKNTAQEGLTTVKKVAANFGENGMNFGRPRPSLAGMDGLEILDTGFVRNIDESASIGSKLTDETAGELSRLDILRQKYGKISPEELNQRINLRSETAQALQDLKATGIGKNKLGPAFAGVYDKKTGEYYYAINDFMGEIPELHPLLDKRLLDMPQDVIDSYTFTKGAGSHAEVLALNKALQANPTASIEDFMVNVIRTGQAKTKPLGMMFDRCPHCAYLTEGFKFISEGIKIAK
ncbi:YwqJ-related putative deaminase [Listeria booriae]|uniref:YwqJ-related putative deaminase n=1 Tax=Listeria booriae TaxID=1552123 RepID=UPI0016298090|nr:YwqJ-related putative deaminase [Listeria booriae]